MSGEMNTSLGNGFTNLMFIKFICYKKFGVDVTAFVEGDDGIFSPPGPVSDQDFLDCGLLCKLIDANQKITSPFCGIIFNYTDNVNITNPIKVILKTPWLHKKYVTSSKIIRLQLLKSKSLSLLWQYPGCPITQSYGLWLLKSCFFVDNYVRDKDIWYRNEDFKTVLLKTKEIDDFDEILSYLPIRHITVESRMLMQKHYDITIDTQLYIEDLFDNKLQPGIPFSDPIIYDLCNDDQKHFDTNYVNEINSDVDRLKHSTSQYSFSVNNFKLADKLMDSLRNTIKEFRYN